ncbi:MAG: hypothetical protein A2293_12320 [Elusimicrobia bacterium RIFOXYB2_FULL_49_7]|nr:MAG: hypothetical protein A2293_12320 [Elusimicrobia bacterium RIFOXYB2_FULL_49_7]
MKKVLLLMMILSLAVSARLIKWDVDGDLDVDAEDLSLLNTKLGLTTGSAGWDALFDMDANGVIDSLDGAEVTRYLNLTDSMALVPAGEFIMGGAGVAYGLMLDTIHVYLDSFLIDKYEISNKKFVDFLNAAKSDTFIVDTVDNDIFKQDGKYYVKAGKENYGARFMTWAAADSFCRSKGKRLPTNAEWEKAARGTDGRLYPWGNEFLDSNLANVNFYCDSFYYYAHVDTASQRICVFNQHFLHLAPIGTFNDVSPYGVHDLCGNLSEWCNDKADLAAPQYWLLPDARHNPQGNNSQLTHIYRAIRGFPFYESRDKHWIHMAYGVGDIPVYKTGARCAR